jgi:hypothetical protein
MPNVPTSNPEQFYQGAPVLSVPDVTATAAFYRRMLGFTSDPGAETPEYAVVWRDNAAVHLFHSQPERCCGDLWAGLGLNRLGAPGAVRRRYRAAS